MQNINSRQQLNASYLYKRYGSWAVVTGASSGIGREMALRLAGSGLNLVLVARSKQVLEQMAVDWRDRYAIEVKVLAVDLAQDSGSKIILDATQNLDIGLLVAAAGFGTAGAFLALPIETEMEMLNVNCRSLLELTWHFGQRLMKRGNGGIVLMSSIVGFQGTPFAAHYAATKAYVQTLAEALYVELAPMGIDVIASAPGPTNSGFASRAGMKLGMALNPEDVAQATLDALGKKPTILPGFISKLLTYSLAFLPRWARVQIMGGVMRDMTKHQRG
ncbi:SDR family oxidoreductase [Pseudanabaena sp. 'Roaring Creek']|uniref:SDR family NAD(P)-dependent oxidoreductase n=1 Tax=Pseudanabaena sp. 'Roaring Creek' TaxID=1681830 RepID=UPI0006D76493|nr:SDR family NAD(P)-dependent oxidoreductase [Pseudanabaena sp. 'Roaring Creek']